MHLIILAMIDNKVEAQKTPSSSLFLGRMKIALQSQQFAVVKRILTPANSSLLIGLVVGLVPTLKKLFCQLYLFSFSS